MNINKTTTVHLSEDNIKEAVKYWLKDKYNEEVSEINFNVKELHDDTLECYNTCIGYEITAKGK